MQRVIQHTVSDELRGNETVSTRVPANGLPAGDHGCRLPRWQVPSGFGTSKRQHFSEQNHHGARSFLHTLARGVLGWSSAWGKAPRRSGGEARLGRARSVNVPMIDQELKRRAVSPASQRTRSAPRPSHSQSTTHMSSSSS